jgi:hypothetical protein
MVKAGTTAMDVFRPISVSEFVPAEGDAPVVLAVPVELTPFSMGSLLVLEDETLGISVCGQTRDELETALYDELSVLWRLYAQAADDDLDGPATELKQKWLERVSP